MECRFCRGEIPEGANVCPNCGTPVEPERTETGGAGYEQGGYQYGGSEQSQGGYQYGAPEQSQGGYQYGAPEQSQGGYQYGTPEQSQGGYQYGGQSGYQYGTPDQGNYGQPQQQISGTPYMVFAIITTLLCCLPLGIAAIVYASKIGSLQKAGDYAGAQEAAKKARLFTILSAVIGLVASIIYIAIAMVGMKETMPDLPVALEENVDVTDKLIDDTADDVDADDADTDDTQGANVPVEPAQASDELGATWENYTVQVNGQVLTLPCTMEALKATGLTQDIDETPEEYVVNVNEYTWVFFEDAEENYIMVDVINTSDEPKTVGECLVGGITADEWGTGGAIDIVFPGGLQFGVEKDAVLAAYGEADDVYEGDSIHIYTWEDEDYIYSGCEIEFDADTGLVSRMDIENFGE